MNIRKFHVPISVMSSITAKRAPFKTKAQAILCLSYWSPQLIQLSANWDERQTSAKNSTLVKFASNKYLTFNNSLDQAGGTVDFVVIIGWFLCVKNDVSGCLELVAVTTI